MGKTSRTANLDIHGARTSGVTGPVEANVDPRVGETINGKVVAPLSGDNSVLSHLWYGVTQSAPNGVITYSFMTTPKLTGKYNAPKDQGYINDHGTFFPGQDAANGYYAFTADQKAAARDAIQLWDDLIPQTFKEVKGNGADIQFANSSDPAQAYAWPPYWGGQGNKFQGDVFTHDPVTNTSNADLGIGEYGFTTLIHEIGHTLGFSHPGDYNFSDDDDGDGQPDPINYAGDAQYFQDSKEYTIMSYFSASETAPVTNWDFTYSGGLFSMESPQGPLLHDIYAIQQAYGADPTTRVGNTTYGFNSNAGNALFDFNQNELPYYAVYDAGGVDTIDASGFVSSQYINLNPGTFSSIGDVTMSQHELGQAMYDFTLANLGIDLTEYFGLDIDGLGALSLSFIEDSKADNEAAIKADTGVSGIETVWFDNFAIAYNTIIENAVGGQGNDLIVGNDVANRIDGQGGDDVLTGGGQSDTFIFHDDGSTDTVTDFATGVDKIDLSAFDVDASAVHYDATTHTITIDGSDASIVLVGADFNAGTDLIL